MLAWVNDQIVGRNAKQDKNENDRPNGEGGHDDEKQDDETKEEKNEGTIILDATCAPQNIRFPTDASLLNEAGLSAIRSGDLRPITAWLEEHVWKYGKLYDPMELLEKAVGEPFDPRYFTDYLEEKFSALYGL